MEWEYIETLDIKNKRLNDNRVAHIWYKNHSVIEQMYRAHLTEDRTPSIIPRGGAWMSLESLGENFILTPYIQQHFR